MTNPAKVPSPETVGANVELLKIFLEEERHQQNTTFSVIIIFITANAGLFTAYEFLVRSWGPSVVALIGLSSVLISFLSAIRPRRQWFRAMDKGFKVQQGLEAMGIDLIAKPFGSKPTKGGLRTTHAVHLVGLVVWGYCLWLSSPWGALLTHPH